jgi:hypothetical protein
MGEAVSKMIGEIGREHLSFVFEPAERARVDHAIAIALKFIAIGMGKLRIAPPTRTLHRKSQMYQAH